MAQKLSGVTIVIFIATGVLTFILLFIFAKRQIMRFALRSRRGPHIPVGHGAKSQMKREIDHLIDIIPKIICEPVLLDEDSPFILPPGTQPPVHYCRLKAVNDVKTLEKEILRQDGTLRRGANENLRSFLLMALASPINGCGQKLIHQFCDLYELARHDPSEFGEEEYQLYTKLLYKLVDVAKLIKSFPNSIKNSPNRTPMKKSITSDLRLRPEKKSTEEEILRISSDKDISGIAMEPINITDFNFAMEINGPLHHTDRYVGVKNGTEEILRRGLAFVIHFKIAGRAFQVDLDAVRISFSFGADAKTTKNTKGVATVESSLPPATKPWCCCLSDQKNGEFTVKVLSPADIPVGLWLCQLEVGLRGGKLRPNKLAKGIHFLFNPWCKDDTTFMQAEDLLDEYILNDVGKIWVGAYNSCRGREWVFGQFDKYVLPACLLLLERSKLPLTARGDPVKVSRAISKLVNANDDRGVVIGKWSEPYSNGVPPAAWTGSAAILKQFLLTGREVGYGQCWVFAGVLTTVCRALGLPSRVVSNLVSAHDANASLTIDRFYDEDLKAVYPDDVGEDSIWNFHVWNDVWMSRPTLPPGYGGWQAVDATPQETSEGFFQCGPASVNAVKAGKISYPFDGGFVYASVNADIIRWKEDSSTDFGYIQIQVIHDHIGKMILTKKPFLFDPNGDQDREDITDQYKQKEGSAGERLVVYNAVAQNDEAKKYYSMPNKKESDIEFKLLHLERIQIGENYKITLQMKNKGKQARSVKALLTSTSVFYTGIAVHDVKVAATQRTLTPGSREELSTTVTAADYVPHLVEYGIMKISAICSVSETNQTWADEDDFQVLKPNISIKILNKAVVDQPFHIQFSFMNPVIMTLSKGFFTFEAPGVIKQTTVQLDDIGPESEALATHSIIPRYSGKFRLIVSFYSKELHDITGSCEFKVSKAK